MQGKETVISANCSSCIIQVYTNLVFPNNTFKEIFFSYIESKNANAAIYIQGVIKKSIFNHKIFRNSD